MTGKAKWHILVFWCKPLNTVWLIIPDSEGKPYKPVYNTGIVHSYWHKKNCSCILKISETYTGAPISPTHTFSTHRWVATKAKFKDNESGSVSFSKQWETVRDTQRNETSYNVDIYQARPRNTSRSTPQFPSPSLLCLLPHHLRQEMQCYAIKTYQGMKN